MAGKKSKPEAEKVRQRARTRKNKREKYERLLKEEPNHKDVPVWKGKMSKL